MKPLIATLITALALSASAATKKKSPDPKTGTVVVQFIINEQGNVEEPRIVSSTNPEFNQPTLTAVTKWKFKPAIKDGKPTRTRAEQKIEFNLEEGINPPPKDH